MTCLDMRQSDEIVCTSCGLRWGTEEDRPECPKKAETDAREGIELVLAKAIIGPRLDKWIGRDKMLSLRKHKWASMITRNEQREATMTARAVLKELKAMPRDELLRVLDQGNWE